MRARNTLHSCLPLEFIQELTIFHSRLFNISALTLSDLGSKMLDSCCSVGCSNRRRDKPRFFFIAFKTRPPCYQVIVDRFWFNFSRTHSKVAILLGLVIKAVTLFWSPHLSESLPKTEIDQEIKSRNKASTQFKLDYPVSSLRLRQVPKQVGKASVFCHPIGNTTMPVENIWDNNLSCQSPDQVFVLVFTRKLCQMIKNSVR